MGLTAKGAALYAKVQTGIELHFTRIAMGDGDLGSIQAINLNALISEKVSLAVTELEVLSGGMASIGGVMQPSDVVVGFFWKELGVFATDPDAGEILYWYGNAGAQSEWIPPNGGGTIVEKHINVNPIVGNATNVTATIDESLIYVTVQDLQIHEKDYTLQIPYAGVTAGAANTYAIAAPVITVLTAGMAVSVKFNLDSTGTSTLNWCGLGAKPIKKANGANATNLKASGIYTLRYDGTAFILQGEGGEYGTATAADVRAPKTIGTDAGIVVGTAADNGPTVSETINLTTNNQEYTIAAGFHSGLRKIKAVITNLAASVIAAGQTVGGVVGTFTADATITAAVILNGYFGYANGARVNGGMKNRPQLLSEEVANGLTQTSPTGRFAALSAWIQPGGGGLWLMPPDGYYDGVSSYIFKADPNFIAANILNTKSIFGLQGAVPVRTNTDTGGSYPQATNDSIYEGAVYLMPPAGYYDGTVWLMRNEPNLLAANVKHGVVIGTGSGGKITGTYGNVLVAGETVLNNISGSTYTTSTTYVLNRQCRIWMTGTVRCKFSFGPTSDPGPTCYATIFVNGVQRGVEHTCSGTTLAVVEDISIEAGDLIQLYVKSVSGQVYIPTALTLCSTKANNLVVEPA